MNNEVLYENIMKNVAKEVKRTLNEKEKTYDEKLEEEMKKYINRSIREIKSIINRNRTKYTSYASNLKPENLYQLESLAYDLIKDSSDVLFALKTIKLYSKKYLKSTNKFDQSFEKESVTKDKFNSEIEKLQHVINSYKK